MNALPLYALVESDPPVDPDRLRPVARETMRFGMFEEESEVLGGPAFGAVKTLQKGNAGHVIIVIVAEQNDVDVINAKLARQSVEAMEHRSSRGYPSTLRPLPRADVWPQIDTAGIAVVDRQRLAAVADDEPG